MSKANLPSSVVSATSASANQIPIANGSGSYVWRLQSGGTGTSYNLGNLASTVTLQAVSSYPMQYGILTANTVITLPTPAANASLLLVLTQDSSGGHIPSLVGQPLAYPAGTPVYITTSGSVNILELRCWDGANWEAFPVTSGVSALEASVLKLDGSTGASNSFRFVGATSSGAPSSGTYAANDIALDLTGNWWLCTTAGTPGSWTEMSGGGSGSVNGVTVTGTPSANQLIVATSSTAATWQTYTGRGTAQALPGNDADGLLLPRHYALIAWTSSPFVATSSIVMSPTYTYLSKIFIPRTSTVSSITINVISAGTSLTSGSCLAGIYSSSGTLIAQTSDQSSVWNSTGIKTMALASPLSITGGEDIFVWVGLCAANTSGSEPAFGGVGTNNFTNLNVSAANSFSAQTSAGLPSSFTPSGLTQATPFRWAALS
jgi:hypothetical protein